MIRVNFIGTAGGLGVTTLTLLAAQAEQGMAVERGPGDDMAATLGVGPVRDDVFRHRFGPEQIMFADCGCDVPPPLSPWANVLVVPRRYVGLRRAPAIIATGLNILGYVDVSTAVDVLSKADVHDVMGGLNHLGSMTHTANMARVIDAGLMNARTPKQATAEAAAITASIRSVLEDA